MTTTPNHSNGQQIQTKSSQQEIVGSKRWNQSTSAAIASCKNVNIDNEAFATEAANFFRLHSENISC
jgi:hypothetical protein